MENNNRIVFLVEENYKGELARCVLTPEDFEEHFPDHPDEPISLPDEESVSYTRRPLIHAWYALTTVGSENWNTFIRDLTWGLSESDIENHNYAFIDWGRVSDELKDAVMDTITSDPVLSDAARSAYQTAASTMRRYFPTEFEYACALCHLLNHVERLEKRLAECVEDINVLLDD